MNVTSLTTKKTTTIKKQRQKKTEKKNLAKQNKKLFLVRNIKKTRQSVKNTLKEKKTFL